MKTLALVVGTRPNFMKIAPVFHAMQASRHIRTVLVDGGQHRDRQMSSVFREELGLPEAHHRLEPTLGSNTERIAGMLLGFRRAFEELGPHRVLVPGDVNATLAATLAANQMGIPVAHLEAGLRSFDREMPEEVNRVLVDHVSDLHLTPSADADVNLRREGIIDSVRCVGNAMIDSVVRYLPAAREALPKLRQDLGLEGPYALCTFHRPSNVDDDRNFTSIFEELTDLAQDLPVLFPVHPRTRPRAEELSHRVAKARLRLLDPLSYLEFLALQSEAAVVITDSGGVQEETTWLGVPCVTVRHNTERPVTISHGTNVLAPPGVVSLAQVARQRLAPGAAVQPRRPDLWDGRTGERVARILEEVMR